MAYGKCFLCGKYGQVERHHAFPGALRDKADKYGLTVDLCALECHREGKKAVHRCEESRLKVQKYCQKKAMREQGWSVEDFIREFGKNYLDPEDLENDNPSVSRKADSSLKVNCPEGTREAGLGRCTREPYAGETFGFRLLEPVALFI